MKELTGKTPSIHICDKSKGIWEAVMDTGISSFSIDNVKDIGEAKQIMGHKITIMGNVPPVDVMQKGTRSDVLAHAKRCIKRAYDSEKGYILSSGCQIPINSPIENVEALMDAVRMYGSYPINEEFFI